MTEFALPPRDIKRWTSKYKEAVVLTVIAGALRWDEACKYYDLSSDELMAWTRLYEKHGRKGLRTTRLRIYRGEHGPAAK